MNGMFSTSDVLEIVKDEKKEILGSFVASTVLLIILIGYSFYSTTNQQVEIAKKNEKQSEFHFILENKEGNIFTDPNIVRSNLIYSFPEFDQLKIKEKKILSKAIDVTYENQTGFFQVSINENNNTKKLSNIGYKLFNQVKNNQIEFFSDKHLYLLDSKPIKSGVAFNLVEDQEASVKTSVFDKKKLILFIFAWLAVGSILSILSISIKNYKSKTIDQRFYLSNQENLLDFSSLNFLSSGEQLNELKAVLNSSDANKIVASEFSLPKDFAVLNNVLLIESLDKLTPSSFMPEEIILVSFKKKTSKNWYKLQKELLKNYQCNVKDILLSKE